MLNSGMTMQIICYEFECGLGERGECLVLQPVYYFVLNCHELTHVNGVYTVVAYKFFFYPLKQLKC